MVAHRFIQGLGTTEDEWLASPRLGAVPIIAPSVLIPPASRVVVCAPHPDDEILPCGGLLAQLRDHATLIIAVTDGEASHSDFADTLRTKRPDESSTALHRLGIAADVYRCRLPDGGVSLAKHDLIETLQRLLRPTDVVLTPWQLDGHPDHEATTHAVLIAAANTGCPPPIEMPIWGWHWAQPSDPALPWHRAVKISLDRDTQRAKASAIRLFQTQTTSFEGRPPILPPHVLRRFERFWEVYFR